MDTDFQQYTWNPTIGPDQMAEQHNLIDDLFFGFEAPSFGNWVDDTPQDQGQGRTRRVTITEITDDESNDDWMMIDNDKESSEEEDEAVTMSTDEIFQLLDDVVQDWKLKLECVVGDGLKKLRKSTKEKKLKIKFLPGMLEL